VTLENTLLKDENTRLKENTNIISNENEINRRNLERSKLDFSSKNEEVNKF
jgi:hypothetical protein